MSAELDVDVLVVGAGISGIGAGWHLQTMCPDRTYAIVEGRDDLGGTWDLFRYPGIRSDSDMHTFGYRFKPWTSDQSIADGQSILAYLRETVAEYGLDRHIHYGQWITRADWSSDAARWTVTATRVDPDTGDATEVRHRCRFLFMCSGYYSYKGGYTPDFAGRDRFGGTIVHPQEWPDDLDYADKRVVVIGSGATAVTLIPAMAATAAHVTMLQRSPSYMVSRPDTDPIADRLRRFLPERAAYAATRYKNIRLSQLLYRKTRTEPDKMRDLFISGVRKELGDDYDVDTHFTPTYDPWDQRLCLDRGGEFFEAIRSGVASVVTDTIDTFTETGIALAAGDHLEADIIVTATGLQMVTLGEMDFFVDGDAVDFAQTFTYKGLAYSDVPNLASSFGYINASWTLRSDLTCTYVCRVLNHMRETGTDVATPRLRLSDRTMPTRPWIDDFSAGYMQRMMHAMPRQGDRDPWRNTQSYDADRKLLGKDPIDDGVMTFTRRSLVAPEPARRRSLIS